VQAVHVTNADKNTTIGKAADKPATAAACENGPMRCGALVLVGMLVGCGGGRDLADLEPKDPDLAPRTVIDRFSAEAGTLHVRDAQNGLPGPGEPIDFDALFTTNSLGPAGELIVYYDFDVQTREPALLYNFYYENSEDRVPDQISIVDVVPGEEGYNDFWWVNRVYVPRDYKPNSITSVDEIIEFNLTVVTVPVLINCPLVPEGSTATLRYDATQDPAPSRFWYEGEIVYSLFFEVLEVDAQNLVPINQLYVSFNINPDQPGGGPASGFMTEPGPGLQTHNVGAAIPPDPAYSPLWNANFYDNADFNMVVDKPSALAANILVHDAALVNCPVVRVGVP
jgi:hypothetical protein